MAKLKEKSNDRDGLDLRLARTTKSTTCLSTQDYRNLAAIVLLASCIRLYRLSYPSSVVFDEVHFGGFATKYIKGQFFMDVHPPLAKMLIALVGWLAGFKGDFDFKDIGKDYIEPGVPYVAMRLLPALLGVAVVPIAYLTLIASNCSRVSATLASCLVIFENGLVTQSRLILLDSPLLFFTALTAYSWSCFTRADEDKRLHFSAEWWKWLALTGIALGATVSVKWVGLFTIGWLGVLTVHQLFTHLGNLQITLPRLGQHFAARAMCLIVIPVAFYAAMFYIHFLCLVNPGEGDGFMSAEFQSTLNNKYKDPTLAAVSYGSRVTIRHLNTQGGYLHSHVPAYPGGSKQQQVTLYPHKDHNNDWVLHNQTDIYNITMNPPLVIEDGAVLRLFHPSTQKRLHSHDVRPIVTEVDWQNEVSAYGFEGFEGDANDYFRVEIYAPETPQHARAHLRAIDSKFRLIHIMTGCALFSHKVKLPDWGFEQQEVTCAKGGTIPNSLWYIESNTHDLAAPDAEQVNYRKLGFFGKFIELNKVMWKTNAGLVESHNWDSRPSSWPTLRRGINFWGKDNRHVYLLGNVFVWAVATLSIVTYATLKIFGLLRWQRGYLDHQTYPQLQKYDLRIGTYVLGWAFHYLPFFLMERQLFLHHYFPALYFSVLAFSQLFDFATLRLSRHNASAVAGLLLLGVIGTWYVYAPISYGSKWTKSSCEKTKLLTTWDYDCNTFPDEYAAYQSIDIPGAPAAVGPTPTSAVPVAAKPIENAVQPEVAAGDTLVDSKQTIYQDAQGHVLSPNEVKALGDNVEFVTRYEELNEGTAGVKGTLAEAPESRTGDVNSGKEKDGSGLNEPVNVEADVEGLNKEGGIDGASAEGDRVIEKTA